MLGKEQIQAWRRDLHQIPETGLETWQTAAYLKKELEGMNLEITDIPEAGASFTAFMDNNKDWTIAFRTDMDGLPVPEQTGNGFESGHPGCMHACGHDGHMTMWLGAAKEINAVKDRLDCNVLFIAQSGEESPGGARPITESCVFEKYNVKQVYGIHIMPKNEDGVIYVRPEEMMARCSEVKIRIHGKSVHAARYKEGHDAVQAGAELLYRMYELEQSLPDSVWRLLRFGILHGGTACNVVSDDCLLHGTLRSYQDEVFDHLADGIRDLCAQMEEKYGVAIDLDIGEGYPAVINDRQLTEDVLGLFDNIVRLEKPELISEDFSFYQKKARGVFFFLGTSCPYELHSGKFDFDESVLQSGIALYKRLAEQAAALENR
ncbi:MAG: amidohydrolase [Erysipelotrichaceae bacterium]|nr:amidohydrolase [Erysipelotrichaceae bacterium]